MIVRAFVPTFCFLLLSACSSLVAQSDSEQLPPVHKETVILLHGLGKGSMAMLPLADSLKQASYDVIPIEYNSLTDNPEQIIEDVSRQIASVLNGSPVTVHFVGHSLGGLIIRAYLDSRPDIKLGRVVMIGSPNHGTPLVDLFRDYWLMDLLGPTARELGTENGNFPETLKPPYYPIGIIAGKVNSRIMLSILKAESDGIVPIDSTAVQGMTDFYLIENRHAALRFDENVAIQTIYFLRHGSFNHVLDGKNGSSE